MSSAEGISLLAHLETPILVGDPDGRIVYANPSFRSRFCQAGEDPMGQPLAMVFGGGAREVVLTATAGVLQRGQTARIQIREGAYGYTGLASPIEAEDDRVGVVMVLLEEQSSEDYLNILKNAGEFAFWADLYPIIQSQMPPEQRLVKLQSLTAESEIQNYVLIREKSLAYLQMKHGPKALALLEPWQKTQSIWHASDERLLEYARGQDRPIENVEPLIQTFIRLFY